MDRIYHLSRILFGLWFTGSGIEYFIPSLDLQPLGEMPAAYDFTVALINSGLFAVVKIIEVVIGVSVLANRWVLLSALACLPLTFVITWWNVVLEGTWAPLLFGVVVPAINVILLWPYRRFLTPLLAANPARQY